MKKRGRRGPAPLSRETTNRPRDGARHLAAGVALEQNVAALEDFWQGVLAHLDQSGSRSGSAPRRATVKWFNSTKGFGFVTLDDGSDAFCHASALSSLPSQELAQGATVYCDIAHGQRGMQVTHVHRVEEPSGGGAPQMRGGGARPQRPPRGESSGAMGDGHVKFFNEEKGFGFVVPESGAPDVYVHASALRRSGLSTLLPEQRVRFSTRQGTKGVEVDHIEVA